MEEAHAGSLTPRSFGRAVRLLGIARTAAFKRSEINETAISPPADADAIGSAPWNQQ